MFTEDTQWTFYSINTDVVSDIPIFQRENLIAPLFGNLNRKSKSLLFQYLLFIFDRCRLCL